MSKSRPSTKARASRFSTTIRVNLSAHTIDNVTACCPVVYNQTGDEVPTEEYEFYETAEIEVLDTSDALEEGETAA